MQQIGLLELAETLKDLCSFFRFQLRQLCKDFGTTHDEILGQQDGNGKRCISSSSRIASEASG